MSGGWERQVRDFLGWIECCHATEFERELAVRTLTCPTCGAERDRRCVYGPGRAAGAYSHTGRYNLAADRGLVPALGGVR